jgi:hypothetical protein
VLLGRSDGEVEHATAIGFFSGLGLSLILGVLDQVGA